MRRKTSADASLRSTRSNAGDFLTNLTGCVYSAVLQAHHPRAPFPHFTALVSHMSSTQCEYIAQIVQKPEKWAPTRFFATSRERTI